MPNKSALPAQRLVRRLLEVDREDLRAVTSAVMDNWIECYTCGSGREVYQCRYCGEEQKYDFQKHEIANPDHKPNCAVLIATSIRPNAELNSHT